MDRLVLACAPLLVAFGALWGSCVLNRDGTKEASDTNGPATTTTSSIGGSPTVGGFGGMPSVGGSGGVGGSEGCVTPAECPGIDETCQFRACTAGVCGFATAADDTPCAEDGGNLCDSGQCVAWDPGDLAGLALWLRPDLGVSATGAAVTSWANQGALGGSFVQAVGAKQPSTITVDGADAVSWDGVDDALVYHGGVGDWTFLHDGTGATAFIVFTLNSAAASGSAIDTLRLLDTRVGLSLRQEGGGQVAWRVGAGNAPLVLLQYAPAAVTSKHVAVLRLSSGESPQFSFRVDLSDVASGTLAASPSTANAFGGLTLGNQAGEGDPLNGAILEVGALTTYLDSEALLKLEAYLASRYGL